VTNKGGKLTEEPKLYITLLMYSSHRAGLQTNRKKKQNKNIEKVQNKYEFNSQYCRQNTNTRKKRKEHKIQDTMMKIV